jgi:hypothetical protein
MNLEEAFSPIKKTNSVPIFEHKSVVETYEKEKKVDPNFEYELSILIISFLYTLLILS